MMRLPAAADPPGKGKDFSGSYFAERSGCWRTQALNAYGESLPASSSSPSRTPSSSRSMPARTPEPGGVQV
jgi:hypothetical protein